MIKINLANSLVKKADIKGGMESSSGGGIAISQQANSVIKLILILAPVLGLYVYEKFDIGAKTERMQAVKTEHTQLTTELQKVGSVDDIVRQVNEQKKELDDKFSVMRQIFGLRSQKLQSLTALQTHIPQSCWMKKLTFKDSNVTVEGYSMALEDAQVYSTLLAQERNLFDSVVSKGITSEKVADMDLFKFTIEIKLKD